MTSNSSNPLALPVGTKEYVIVSVTGNVTLDAQPVEISLDAKTTWLPATWLGAAGTTRQVRTADVVDFNAPRLTKQVFVRVTDTPEIPVIPAGYLVVR